MFIKKCKSCDILNLTIHKGKITCRVCGLKCNDFEEWNKGV